MEHEISPWILIVVSFMIAAVLVILSYLGTRRLDKIPETNAQNMVEFVVESLNNFVVGIIGPGGERFTPFIGSLFIYIFAMNLIGLVPVFPSPTSSLAVTLSLGIVVFVMYNYYGIRSSGLKAYVLHMCGEPLWLAPLMLPIHLIGEIARPVSLAFRLFGNIFGKEMVMFVLAGFSIIIVPYFIAIPWQFPIMVFGVLVSLIQALVFCMLTCIYIAIAISCNEHGH